MDVASPREFHWGSYCNELKVADKFINIKSGTGGEGKREMDLCRGS
jgi:hypothetical protein